MEPPANNPNNGHKIPMNIQSDEQSDIPAGQVSEFLFGMTITQTEETVLFHETKSFDDDIDLGKLPVVMKHMGLVAGAVREFVRITPKA